MTTTVRDGPRAEGLDATVDAPVDAAADTAVDTPDEVAVRGTLSPSRAGDFLGCPLVYRFRSVDRLREPPSSAAARGTLVHAVLERLYDLPPAGRTADAARALVAPQWERLLEEEPDVAALFTDDDDGVALAAWLASARDLVGRYFALEDPTRLQPAERELLVETVLPSRLRLRGIVDRLDVAADGATRIVDYKSGRAPGVGHEARALFQLRFYALVLWRATGRVPGLLQLLYLGGDGPEALWYAPDEADLLATQRKVDAVWDAIERAARDRDWRPRPGQQCDWCGFRALCPAFGGTPPPLPERSPADPPELEGRLPLLPADEGAPHGGGGQPVAAGPSVGP